MIRLNDIRLPLDYTEESLRKAAASQLRLPADAIRCVSLYKRSIDARKKDRICFLASLDVKLHQNEKGIASKCRNATVMEEYFYSLPSCRKLDKRPVIIGSGPCGLFAGLNRRNSEHLFQYPVRRRRRRNLFRRQAQYRHQGQPYPEGPAGICRSRSTGGNPLSGKAPYRNRQTETDGKESAENNHPIRRYLSV